MLETYLSADEYKGSIPEDQREDMLYKASRAIDSLTYNRIVASGFAALTEFQQELVKDSVQLHANFMYDNAELLDSPLSSYSIGSVSMSFDRSKIVTVAGVTTSSEVYNLLMQTGLCSRGLM